MTPIRIAKNLPQNSSILIIAEVWSISQIIYFKKITFIKIKNSVAALMILEKFPSRKVTFFLLYVRMVKIIKAKGSGL